VPAFLWVNGRATIMLETMVDIPMLQAMEPSMILFIVELVVEMDLVAI